MTFKIIEISKININYTKILYFIGTPAIITLFCELLIEVMNFYFVGHLNNPSKVAGVGLGTMYVNILC